MPKKIKECSKAHLISVALPDHGDSYTVISHESVINHVYAELAQAGFGIVSEDYRATADQQSDNDKCKFDGSNGSRIADAYSIKGAQLQYERIGIRHVPA
jgi:hypothetical protein